MFAGANLNAKIVTTPMDNVAISHIHVSKSNGRYSFSHCEYVSAFGIRKISLQVVCG